MITDYLSNRTISAFPLSVGTSLALESIYEASAPSIDPERVIPQKVTINDYSEFWINISTLVRNIFGALSKEGTLSVLPWEVAEVIETEAEMIQFLTQQQSSNRVKTYFYANTHQDLQTKYPDAKLRASNTEAQQIYKLIHDQAIEIVMKNNLSRADMYRLCRGEILPESRPKALILTHMAYDLLSHDHFQTLDLIESHTGVLKKKTAWYTKYNDGKSLPPMPFMSGLLQVFGDKETFAIADIRLKREVIELAQTNRWTPVTTMDKIRYDAEKLVDADRREKFKRMLRA